MKKTILLILAVLMLLFVSACVEPTPPDNPTHTCEHKCDICGKCQDTACQDTACAAKCEGHEPEAHTCESICDVCGKCNDAACTDAACANKCEGHKTVAVNENYSLWNGVDDISYNNVPSVHDVEKSVVINCEEIYGGKYFVHGIAIERFERDGKNVLVATWAYNPVAENTPGEQAHYAFSYDDGKTWTEPREIKSNTKGYSASHGVMWYYQDTLYAMIPVVMFETSPWTIKCELNIYNFETEQWEYQNDCCHGFWPTSKPVKLDTGNWIVGGPVLSLSGRAITEGDNFTKWRVMQTGKEENRFKFSETGLAVNGNMAVLIGRNENSPTTDSLGVSDSGRYELGVAVSYDYGETFTKMKLSGVYSSPSKPMCGTLSDGRFYMIWNMDVANVESRHRLLLGIGDPNTGAINQVYMLAYYAGGISYPYALEADGYLYVAYSQSIANRVNGNQNNLVMVKIPLTSLED